MVLWLRLMSLIILFKQSSIDRAITNQLILLLLRFLCFFKLIILLTCLKGNENW